MTWFLRVEGEGWLTHQGALTPQVLGSPCSLPPSWSLAGLPSMHHAGLGDPTHPSKEYLLVLGMSMMSMKPRFPAGSGWGVEGRELLCWGREPP